ncbi:MAG TPA: TetR/AcrR family transcriptional regulator C-terminal domain-containing protein [Trebonia sp.]|nr:TetR/AcrR family transcriptional regulator C-terminal domain-containing protein [Trebonia sp.]
MAGVPRAQQAVARRPRGTLNRADIVAAAFELAAGEDGVDGLSMPRLARQLKVGVTSLYWYFRSKDELMSALTEEAADRLYQMLPDYRGRPWDEHLHRYFCDFRRVFLDNPAVCDLLVLRAPSEARSPESLRRFFALLEREISALVDAGFPVRDAVEAYMTLSVYTRGCVLNERLFRTAEEQAERGGYLMPQPDFDPDCFPVMARAAEYWVPSFSTQEKFEAGIGFIIDGLRGRLASVTGH